MLAGVASCLGLALSAVAVAAINAGGFSYKAGLAAQAIPLTVSLLPWVCLFAAAFLRDGRRARGGAAGPARGAAGDSGRAGARGVGGTPAAVPSPMTCARGRGSRTEGGATRG